MQLLAQRIIFFVIFALLCYIAWAKNIFGMGVRSKSKKVAVLNAVFTSLLATVIFVVLLYFF